MAHAAGAYASLLGKLSRIDVLVLDDFLLNPMTESERRDPPEAGRAGLRRSCII